MAARGRARRWAWGLRWVVASLGVEAIAKFAKECGKKPSGCTGVGVTLVTGQPRDGVSCKDTKYGKDECWG